MRGLVADPHHAPAVDTDCSRALGHQIGTGRADANACTPLYRQRDAIETNMHLSGQSDGPATMNGTDVLMTDMGDWFHGSMLTQ